MLNAIDLHAHFPMQLKYPPLATDPRRDKLLGQLLRIARRLASFDPLRGARVTLRDAKKARVGFGSVLHDPANEFCPASMPFANIREQLRLTESAIDDRAFRIVRTPAELEDAIAQDLLPVFHCLEGGFSLESAYNIAELADRGVAYIILAHLLYRGVARIANALPCFTDRSYDDLFHQPNVGLTDLGKDICRAMFREGVLVDLTHMAQPAIDDVFRIAAEFDPHPPIIASHVCPRSRAAYMLNPSDETMRRIADSGGLIGIIWFGHWLRPAESTQNDLQLVVDAIRTAVNVVGVECVGVGSDLDGFLQPVDGLHDIGAFGALAEALRNNHFDSATIGKILHGNVRRVLARGWRVRAVERTQ
jgi:microsomal dipeptidase-like Zn-dependent dipeptidase